MPLGEDDPLDRIGPEEEGVGALWRGEPDARAQLVVIGSSAGGIEALSRLVATLPRLDPRSPQGGVAPGLEGRLYRATKDGRELLETWSSGAIEVVVPGPGVYRVEVWMTPRQLAPYLGAVAANYTETPVPWIYSGAIFVR